MNGKPGKVPRDLRYLYIHLECFKQPCVELPPLLNYVFTVLLIQKTSVTYIYYILSYTLT